MHQVALSGSPTSMTERYINVRTLHKAIKNTTKAIDNNKKINKTVKERRCCRLSVQRHVVTL